MERAMGVEPTPSAWKAEVLPLNYTRYKPTHYELVPTLHPFPKPRPGDIHKGLWAP